VGRVSGGGKVIRADGGGNTGVDRIGEGGERVIRGYNALFWLVGGLMHLWTVYIAYSVGGLLWAAASFFFPVISEIYFGYDAWKYDGFNTAYIQWLLVVFAMWLFRYVLLFISYKRSDY
jgi:hypothetical protein